MPRMLQGRSRSSPARKAPAPAPARREHPFIGLQRRIGYTAACGVVQRKAKSEAAAASAPPAESADLRDAAEKQADLDAGVGAAVSAAADPKVPVAQLPGLIAEIKRAYGMISLELTPVPPDPGAAVASVIVTGRVNPPRKAVVAVPSERAAQIAAASASAQSAPAAAGAAADARMETGEPAPAPGAGRARATPEEIEAKRQKALARLALAGGSGAGSSAASASAPTSSTGAPTASHVFPQPGEFWFGRRAEASAQFALAAASAAADARMETEDSASGAGAGRARATPEEIEAKRQKALARLALAGGSGAGSSAASASAPTSLTGAPAASHVFPQPNEFWFGQRAQARPYDPAFARSATPNFIGTRVESWPKLGLVEALHHAGAQNINITAEAHETVAVLSFNGERQAAYHSTQGAAHAEQNLATDFDNAMLRYRQRQPASRAIDTIHITLNLNPCGRNPYLRVGDTNKGCADLLVDLKARTDAGGSGKIKWFVSYHGVYRLTPEVEAESTAAIARLKAAGITIS